MSLRKGDFRNEHPEYKNCTAVIQPPAQRRRMKPKSKQQIPSECPKRSACSFVTASKPLKETDVP
jgi:hypothetical protein